MKCKLRGIIHTFYLYMVDGRASSSGNLKGKLVYGLLNLMIIINIVWNDFVNIPEPTSRDSVATFTDYSTDGVDDTKQENSKY